MKKKIDVLDLSWTVNDTMKTVCMLSQSVQSLSCVRLFATPWIAAHQASLSITNSRSSLKLMSIESVMPSSHLILCHPLLLLPPILPSIRVFSNKSTLRMRWQKYWSFSFSISPSNERPGLISFRMDWLDLLAIQGTLRSLLQHHSSKASILQHSAFFTVQPSHPLSSPFPPAFNISQHQGKIHYLQSFPVSQFFASCGQVLQLQLQWQSFQRIYRIGFL